jgi:hypothetical protein
MTHSISNYRNFIYRYYRCRSHTGGQSPCPGSGTNAYELEEFVRMALYGSDDEWDEDDSTLPVALTCRWYTLDKDIQRELLPEVIETVHVDMESGKVKIELTPDAVHAVVVAYEISMTGKT